MSNRPHILFAAGGTGGHVFPALAIADELAGQMPGCRIAFGGTGRDWERAVVTRSGYEYRALPAVPMAGSPMRLVKALVSNGAAYRAAARWIQSERPDAVVALGGYACVPLGLAAARIGIPLILAEQNLIPGRATRLLARWASAVCITFRESASYLCTRPRIVHTGNPVRDSIVTRVANRARQANQFADSSPLLVVLGGSQGAHSLNQFVTGLLPSISSHLADWEVIHQTGERDAGWVRDAYHTHQLRCTVTPFIDDIAPIYARATLAIARAGATTLAELAVAGVPAILLPYPYAAANHQWHNAQSYGRVGAAIVIEDRPDRAVSDHPPVSSIVPLFRVPELRREMRLAMLQLGRPDAAAAVVQEIAATLSRANPAKRSA